MDFGFGINTLNKRDEISQFPIVMVRLVQMAHLIEYPPLRQQEKIKVNYGLNSSWLDLAVMFPAQYI